MTLRGGVWHLDRAIQVEKTSGHKTRIDNVQIPVTDASLTKLIVVKFDGDPDPADVGNGRATGILTHETDSVWGASVEPEVRGIGSFPTVLVLCVGPSPRKALLYALGGTAFFLVAVGLAGYFGRAWVRQRREAATVAADVLRYGPR